jgi:hypothetical protein
LTYEEVRRRPPLVSRQVSFLTRSRGRIQYYVRVGRPVFHRLRAKFADTWLVFTILNTGFESCCDRYGLGNLRSFDLIRVFPVVINRLYTKNSLALPIFLGSKTAQRGRRELVECLTASPGSSSFPYIYTHWLPTTN